MQNDLDKSQEQFRKTHAEVKYVPYLLKVLCSTLIIHEVIYIHKKALRKLY